MGGRTTAGVARGGHRTGFARGGRVARYGRGYGGGPVYGGPIYDSCAGYGYGPRYGYNGCPGYGVPIVGRVIDNVFGGTVLIKGASSGRELAAAFPMGSAAVRVSTQSSPKLARSGRRIG